MNQHPRSVGSLLLALGTSIFLGLSGCGSVPTTAEGMQARRDEVVPAARQTLQTMKEQDPSIEAAMDGAYGFAIFPTVASGALILGGEGGDGVVF